MHMKYSAPIPRGQFNDVVDWCRNNFGEPSWNEYNGRWGQLGNEFIFSNEAERNWFLLRWS